MTEQVKRNPSDRECIHAEIFDLKAKLLEILPVAVDQSGLLGRDADHDRWSQHLCVDLVVYHFAQYLLVLHLLVCSMLVNHQHFIAVFNDPVSIEHLSNNPVLLLCLPRQDLLVKEVQLLGLLDDDLIL